MVLFIVLMTIDVITLCILHSIHFALMHVHRVKQCDRCVFLTCPRIHDIQDYILGSETP